jgi:hypothetical protein
VSDPTPGDFAPEASKRKQPRGIGRRLDGWANTDRAIVALPPAFDEATKTEFNAWAQVNMIPVTMRSTAPTSQRADLVEFLKSL